MNELTLMNERLLLNSIEVAKMIGKRHDNLLRDIDGYVEILKNSIALKFEVNEFFVESSYKDSIGRTLKSYDITKKGCEMVANKMTGEKGVLFTAAYVTKFELMETHLQLNQRQPNPAFKESFEMQLIGVEYTSRILRVDETSKIRMLEAAHKQHQVPTNHLPSYVDDEITKSLSTLLKENNVNISAAKVNTRLIELGILEIKERESSKGGTKEFKSLTEKGLKYGKNLINPKNPKETQPHYYTSKFLELIELLGKQVA